MDLCDQYTLWSHFILKHQSLHHPVLQCMCVCVRALACVCMCGILTPQKEDAQGFYYSLFLFLVYLVCVCVCVCTRTCACQTMYYGRLSLVSVLCAIGWLPCEFLFNFSVSAFPVDAGALRSQLSTQLPAFYMGSGY